ncbi:MAG: hypothetical protein H8E62_03315 [Planctomycetes bacterium]|nr:hypothetical protein [Planctomycetota bacterium]
MDIQEIQIGTENKKTKKISPKIIKASRAWLQEKGVDLEDLNEPQRESVFYFIKQKRGFFWVILMSTPCIVLYIVCIIFFLRLVQYQDNDKIWIPQKYAVESEEGEKVYQEVPESLKEQIRLYGKLSLLFGAIGGGLFYTLLSNVVAPIALHRNIKRNNKTISAFLLGNKG